MMTGGDPSITWPAIAALYGIGLVVGLINGVSRRLSQGAVDHRDARHAALRQRRRDDVVGRLAARLSARQFSRLRALRVSRRAGDRPFAARCRRLSLVVARSRGGACTARCSAGACSRSATIRARPSSRASGSISCASAVSSFRRFSAVTAGILLGGFGGVSTDVGRGLELQAIAACVIGGAQLMGGRGTVIGAVSGRAEPLRPVHAAQPARLAAAAAATRRRGLF